MTDPDYWQTLGRYTNARIALGRSGSSLPTAAQLQFQLDHARAKDAVHTTLAISELRAALAEQGGEAKQEMIEVHSRAADRSAYLHNPQLGRELSEPQWQRLRETATHDGWAQCDVVFILGDGLSALASQRHGPPLFQALHTRCGERGLRCSPLIVAHQARVALADDIGEAVNARLSIMMIGERPGLSAADSLGLYLCYQPQRGRSDAERNCISNIHGAGLDYEQAVATCCYLVDHALKRQLSGVQLKDDTDTLCADDHRRIPFWRD